MAPPLTPMSADGPQDRKTRPDGQPLSRPPPDPAILIGHERRLSAVEATIPHLVTKADLVGALQPLHGELGGRRKELAFVRGQLWVLIAVTLAALVPLYLRFLGWA